MVNTWACSSTIFHSFVLDLYTGVLHQHRVVLLTNICQVATTLSVQVPNIFFILTQGIIIVRKINCRLEIGEFVRILGNIDQILCHASSCYYKQQRSSTSRCLLTVYLISVHFCKLFTNQQISKNQKNKVGMTLHTPPLSKMCRMELYTELLSSLPCFPAFC